MDNCSIHDVQGIKIMIEEILSSCLITLHTSNPIEEAFLKARRVL
jgi:hypothetical protein